MCTPKRCSASGLIICGVCLCMTAGYTHRVCGDTPPYPPSEVITRMDWAAPSSIVHKAIGSDGWPVTWADDGHLYTAYADGKGFDPGGPKLSMGLARLIGRPGRLSGTNIRSSIARQDGYGPLGKKASGILMVEGVLYMWVRNIKHDGTQSQLAWSADRGKTWKWCRWRWEQFGYPTFIQFGRNYAGARDRYVYTVSHDHPSAYHSADRFVMMRVPRDQITSRGRYEFFKDLDDHGRARWTKDIRQRQSVFTHPARCLRSGMTYNPAIKRYLWWQQLPHGPANPDTRFGGGFGVYDAPHPWGPWTTVFFTQRWDVGPGETASFPTKWISDDGNTLYLLFSGRDALSIRKATVRVKNVVQTSPQEPRGYGIR